VVSFVSQLCQLHGWFIRSFSKVWESFIWIWSHAKTNYCQMFDEIFIDLVTFEAQNINKCKENIAFQWKNIEAYTPLTNRVRFFVRALTNLFSNL
jgi:hypothetical protein